MGKRLPVEQIVRPPLLNNLLSREPFVFIGKISYVLYLWHWPVLLVFKQTVGLDSPFQKLLAFSLVYNLASVTYHAVETPIRTKYLKTKSHIFATAFFAIATVQISIFLLKGPWHGRVYQEWVYQTFLGEDDFSAGASLALAAGTTSTSSNSGVRVSPVDPASKQNVSTFANTSVVFIGDSLMRYQYLNLAYRMTHGVDPFFEFWEDSLMTDGNAKALLERAGLTEGLRKWREKLKEAEAKGWIVGDMARIEDGAFRAARKWSNWYRATEILLTYEEDAGCFNFSLPTALAGEHCSWRTPITRSVSTWRDPTDRSEVRQNKRSSIGLTLPEEIAVSVRHICDCWRSHIFTDHCDNRYHMIEGKHSWIHLSYFQWTAGAVPFNGHWAPVRILPEPRGVKKVHRHDDDGANQTYVATDVSQIGVGYPIRLPCETGERSCKRAHGKMAFDTHSVTDFLQEVVFKMQPTPTHVVLNRSYWGVIGKKKMFQLLELGREFYRKRGTIFIWKTGTRRRDPYDAHWNGTMSRTVPITKTIHKSTITTYRYWRMLFLFPKNVGKNLRKNLHRIPIVSIVNTVVLQSPSSIVAMSGLPPTTPQIKNLIPPGTASRIFGTPLWCPLNRPLMIRPTAGQPSQQEKPSKLQAFARLEKSTVAGVYGTYGSSSFRMRLSPTPCTRRRSGRVS